jgi:hypothetical protein
MFTFDSFPNHEAGWLTAAAVRKRNRATERERSKKAKLTDATEKETANSTEVEMLDVELENKKIAVVGANTGFVRVPQVSRLRPAD